MLLWESDDTSHPESAALANTESAAALHLESATHPRTIGRNLPTEIRPATVFRPSGMARCAPGRQMSLSALQIGLPQCLDTVLTCRTGL
jgi:hypothetical protein